MSLRGPTAGAMEVSGPMTMETAEGLLAAGAPYAAEGDVSFDLRGVDRVDSSAIAVILGWSRAAHAAGHRVRFENAPTNLRSLAALYGVDEILPLD